MNFSLGLIKCNFQFFNFQFSILYENWQALKPYDVSYREFIVTAWETIALPNFICVSVCVCVSVCQTFTAYILVTMCWISMKLGGNIGT